MHIATYGYMHVDMVHVDACLTSIAIAGYEVYAGILFPSVQYLLQICLIFSH